MGPDQFTIGKALAGQLQQDIREGRITRRNSDAFERGTPDNDPVIDAPNMQWLRVTNSTPVLGFYSAFLQVDGGPGAFADFDGVTPIWLWFPNGYVVTVADVVTPTFFLARQEVNNLDGLALFACPLLGGYTGTPNVLTGIFLDPNTCLFAESFQTWTVVNGRVLSVV